MRILLTNDDGINAPGLAALERIAHKLADEVWVVAPETDQSGKSHSLTLSDPLRLRSLGDRRFAVHGTPTDCVIMGIRHLMPELPDLVLSGVNRGQNVADDIGYSGTVAGAMEGTLLGIRSFALSQSFSAETRHDPKFVTAEAHAPDLLTRLLDLSLPPDIVLNINFPDRPPESVEGIEITSQGKRNQAFVDIDERSDGRGLPYYWIAMRRERFEAPRGTDLRAMAEGRISVTPLRLDMTARDLADRLAGHLDLA